MLPRRSITVSILCVALVAFSAAASAAVTLRIETAPGGHAPQAGGTTLVSGDSLRLYAAVYDSTLGYIGSTIVDWSLVSGTALLDTASGSSVGLRATLTGSVGVRARLGVLEATTPTFDVVAGMPVRLSLFAQAGSTAEIASLTLAADSTLVLYAGSRDAAGNDAGAPAVAWSLTSPLGLLQPVDSSSIAFTAQRTGAGFLRMDAPGLPRLETPVTVTPGRLASLRLLVDSRPAPADTTLTTSQGIDLEVRGFDAQNNAVTLANVAWSMQGSAGTLTPATGPTTRFQARTPGTAGVTATSGAKSAALAVTVVPGALAQLRLSLDPLAHVALPDTTLDADQELELFALGFDATGALIGAVDATWSATDSTVVQLGARNGTRVDLQAVRTGTTRVVVAATGAAPDTSGVLQVVAGQPSWLGIVTRPDGTGTEIGAMSLTADAKLVLYAVGRDADGNFTGRRAANWTLTADIGTLHTTTGDSVVLDAARVGTAFVTASHLLHNDVAGPFQVTPGLPRRLRIEDAAGKPLGSKVLTAADTFTAYVGRRDADGNRVDGTQALWSFDGDSLAAMPTGPASSVAFQARKAGTARLVAAPNSVDAAAGLAADSSLTLQVVPGAITRLEIRDAPGGAGTHLGPRTLPAADAVLLHAAAYDVGDNYLGEVPASWSVELGDAALEPLVGSSTSLVPHRTGPLVVRARHASGADASSDTLQVTAGATVTLQVGIVPDVTSLVAGDSLRCFATGRDAYDNPTGPQAATWSVQGGIGDVVPSFGEATTFVARRTGQGFLTALTAASLQARSGDLAVQPGAATTLVLEHTPGEPFDPVGTATFTTDDTLHAHAVLRDVFGNAVDSVSVDWSLDRPGVARLETAAGSKTQLHFEHPGVVRLRGATPALTSESGDLQVTAGSAAGDIAVQTTPALLRVGGGMVSLTAGPIADRFGNPVADGSIADFFATGLTAGQDLDPVRPGVQRATVAGMASATWASPPAPGSVQVAVRSGAASGAASLEVLPAAAAFLLSLSPADVRAGDTITPRLRVANPETVRLEVESAKLRIVDGNGGVLETVLATPVSIAAGDTAWVDLAAHAAALQLGSYAPLVEVAGRDAFGHAFRTTRVLPASSFRVFDLQLLAMTTGSPRVARGDTAWIDVECRVAPAGLTFVDAALGLDPAGDWNVWRVAPSAGSFLPPERTTLVRFGAVALAGAVAGTTRFEAQVRAHAGRDTLVSQAAAAFASLELVEAVPLEFTSLTPNPVAVGTVPSLRVELQNSGTSDADCDTRTSLVVGSRRVLLTAPVRIAPGETRPLVFAPLDLAGLAGPQAATLELRGSQAGAPLHRSLPIPTPLSILPAPAVQQTPLLASQSRITAGQTSPWNLQCSFENRGGMAATLDSLQLGFWQGTTALGAEYTFTRPPGFVEGGRVLDAGATRTLAFTVTESGTTTGDLRIELRTRWRETSTGRDLGWIAEPGNAALLRVDVPAALELVSFRPSQTEVVAGQAAPQGAWHADLVLRNTGGAGMEIVAWAAAPIVEGIDRSAEFDLDVPQTFRSGSSTLAGGATDTLRIGVLRSGSTPGSLVLEVRLQTRASASGPLQEMTWNSNPAALRLPASLEAGPLVASAAEILSGSSRDWTLQCDLRNTGGANLDLTGLAQGLVLEVDGVDRTAGFALRAPQSTRLAPGATATLVYDIDATPPVRGALRASLQLRALETASGRWLDLAVQSDGPRILLPADIAVLDVAPRRTSRGAPVRFAVAVENRGEAAAHLDSTTAFVLQGDRAFLAVPVQLASGDSIDLVFGEIVADSLGDAAVRLEARGSHAGEALAQDRDAGTVRVEVPAAITILGIDTSQPTVTRDQTEAWTIALRVRNDGEAEHTIDAASIRFFVGGVDRTSTYEIAWLKSSARLLTAASVDTLRFRVTRTGSHTGVATLEGQVRATDRNSGRTIEANTFLGGKGSVRVQAPGVLVASALRLSQVTASAGQARPIDAILVLRNAGEAGLVLEPSWTAALAATPVVPYTAEILTGGSALAAGDSVALRYRLAPMPPTAGSIALVATPSVRESNRDLLQSARAEAAIAVQSPADVQVTGTAGPAAVTRSQARPWEVRFVVENRGASPARLDVPSLVLSRHGSDAAAGFGVQAPQGFAAAGGWQLAGGARDSLVFRVTRTDSVPGAVSIGCSFEFEETASGRRQTVASPSPLDVRLEIEPRVSLDDATLSPQSASRGQQIALAVDARNSGEALLRLDPARCSVRLAGTPFSAALAGSLQLSGGATTRLAFTTATLPATLEPGLHRLFVHLEGDHHGNAWSTDLETAALRVEAETSLEIRSVQASQPEVTRGQLRPWNVRVQVRNHGARFELEWATLAFGLGTGDITANFEAPAPAAFESGSPVLESDSTAVLVFAVQRTANVAGLVVVDAIVRGHDANSGARIETRSTGSARGSVQLLEPARPELVRIEPSQTRLSAGQTSAWEVRLDVGNAGATPWRPDWATAALRIGAARDDSVHLETTAGPEILRSGETVSAHFRITPTGNELGDLPLQAMLSGEQTTDGATRAAAAHPARSVQVQRPARLRFGPIAALVPRAPVANTSQPVSATIEVANDGEADLTRVEILLTAPACTPPETLLVTAVAGGAKVMLRPVVRLPDVAGEVRLAFDARLARDANDSTQTQAWETPPSAHLDLRAETPGALRTTALPSQERVSSGQQSDWWIGVEVANDGDEPLVVRAPRATDVEFRLGGALQTDYLVEAPPAFEGGGLDLPGQSIRSLRYRVRRAGQAGGSLEIRVATQATHANHPEAASATAQSSARIEVDGQPGIRIESTESLTWRRLRGYDDFRVDRGQRFDVRVVVRNTGGTTLDSIQVALESQRGNSAINGDGWLESLAPGAQGSVDFAVTAGTLLSPAGLPEIFLAHITRARDRNSRLAVLPGAAIDNTSFAYVELPAELEIASWIESPEGATDGTLSLGQPFVLSARVTNHGQADVSASGRLRVTLPEGYALQEGFDERFFVPGEVLRWTLVAAPTEAQDSLEVALVVVPQDLNHGEAAQVRRGIATVPVRSVDAGDLEVELSLLHPDGARDGGVSDGQSIEVDVRVRGGLDLVDREAELELPPGWSLRPGQVAKRNLPVELESRWSWALAAGAPAASADLVLRVRARDRNDDSERTGAVTLRLAVERRALLALAAAIVEPVEARDGRVIPGQAFTLRACVRNDGEARLAAAPGGGFGRLRLVDAPAGYSLDGAVRDLEFASDGTARADWHLVAPAAYRPDVDALRIVFESLPVDENSGDAAAVLPDSSQARITLSLADAGVRVTAIPAAPHVSLPGAERVALVAFELANESENEATLEAVGVHVEGLAAVARLHLTRPDGTGESFVPSHQNPTWFPLTRPGLGHLPTGRSIRFEILADFAAGAAPQAVRVRLTDPATGVVLLRVVESGSRTPLVLRTPDPAPLSSDPVRLAAPDVGAYNAPNPFHVGRETTTIYYALAASAEVRVRIYTLQGALVWETRRAEETQAPSLRGLVWDGRNGSGVAVRNGVYVCEVTAGGRATRFKIAVGR